MSETREDRRGRARGGARSRLEEHAAERPRVDEPAVVELARELSTSGATKPGEPENSLMCQLRSTPLGCEISARISPFSAARAGAAAAAPPPHADAACGPAPRARRRAAALVLAARVLLRVRRARAAARAGLAAAGALGDRWPRLSTGAARLAAAGVGRRRERGAMAHSPKSHRWTRSRARGASTSPCTRMFSGLMSRWTTPCSRQCSSARSMLRETTCASGASSTRAGP